MELWSAMPSVMAQPQFRHSQQSCNAAVWANRAACIFSRLSEDALLLPAPAAPLQMQQLPLHSPAWAGQTAQTSYAVAAGAAAMAALPQGVPRSVLLPPASSIQNPFAESAASKPLPPPLWPQPSAPTDMQPLPQLRPQSRAGGGGHSAPALDSSLLQELQHVHRQRRQAPGRTTAEAGRLPQPSLQLLQQVRAN